MKMLLLAILTTPDMDMKTRVKMYADILGNCKIREESAGWIRKESSKLAKIVAARNNAGNMLWDLSLLKEKEVDEMEAVFLSWKKEEGDKMEDFWAGRQKRLMGERWESREGVVEMDYHMKLVERGGAEVDKKDFLRWRESGVAYDLTEDDKVGVDNVTMINGAGKESGYWGDIVTGPFICLGLEQRSDWSVQEQQEGGATLGGLSLTLARLEDMFEKIEGGDGMKNVKILPLSISATSKLTKVFKPRVKISTVWVGLSMTHLVTKGFSNLVMEEGRMVLETPLYLLQVSKELLESFQEKVMEIGSEAGFKSDDCGYDVCKKYSVYFKKTQ